MSDNYQAVYDAVRSRISSCNVGSIVEEAVRNAFDISYIKPIIQQEICIMLEEMQRPSVLFKPVMAFEEVVKGVFHYTARYNGILMGNGENPDAAMRSFDKFWILQEKMK